MKILAVDTSCMMGSVALVEEDSVIAEQTLNIKITFSERLIPSIKTVLESARVDLSEVDAYAVAIGPGSFTGLRIGLGAVKGLAFVTKKPIVGISSLTSLAYNLFKSEIPVVSVIDARRGEFYAAVNRFEGEAVVHILEDTVMSPDDLINYIISLNEKVAFVGDGVFELKDLINKSLQGGAVIPPPALLSPRASNLAYLAMKRLKAGDADDLAKLKPNYIRKSDAEKKTVDRRS